MKRCRQCGLLDELYDGLCQNCLHLRSIADSIKKEKLADKENDITRASEATTPVASADVSTSELHNQAGILESPSK